MAARYSRKALGDIDSRPGFAAVLLSWTSHLGNLLSLPFSICKHLTRVPRVAPSTTVFQAPCNRSPHGHALNALENGSKHLGFQACALALLSNPMFDKGFLPPPSPGADWWAGPQGGHYISEMRTWYSQMAGRVHTANGSLEPSLGCGCNLEAAPLCVGILAFLTRTRGAFGAESQLEVATGEMLQCAFSLCGERSLVPQQGVRGARAAPCCLRVFCCTHLQTCVL